MSQHQALRRVPVPQQVAQSLKTVTIPAPTRGVVQSENEAFTQPGSAIVSDNWVATLRGVKLRAGYVRWCQLPETTPVISGFDYVSGEAERMYAANATKLYDVTSTIPVLIAADQGSGNWSAAHFSNQGGDWIIAVNDAGDPPLRSVDGIVWAPVAPIIPFPTTPSVPATTPPTLIPHPDPINGAPPIYGPIDPATGQPDPAFDVAHGGNLVYVCKYRNRLFFIEASSMNAWYLGINSIGGELSMIPLAGSTTKGGWLLFAAVWSVDAGDGLDDKLVFLTTEGEALVFTGSNPSEAAQWRQEGRYNIGKPLGMNAHFQIGGDLFVMTEEGIVPMSQAIQKTGGQLELAMITRNIKPMWRDEVLEKREHPWTAKKWEEYGGLFITLPGGAPGQHRCLVANNATGAWSRFTQYDAMCWLLINHNLYFGTQTGAIMQAERTGYDNGLPYTATLVGGWEMFQQPSSTVVWHQARAVFISNQDFLPQLSATVDFEVTIPPKPEVIPDTSVLFDVWDQGLWDHAKWDQVGPAKSPHRNTMWVSIGYTGFTHAPIVQVSIGQVRKPDVELIAVAATYERAGVNV